MSSQEDFLALAKRNLAVEPVTVKAKQYYIHELSEADAANMEVELQTKKGYDWTAHRRVMVAYCLRDESGRRVITDPNVLKDLPRSVVGPLYDQCLEINKYDQGEIEALAKKSERADA